MGSCRLGDALHGGAQGHIDCDPFQQPRVQRDGHGVFLIHSARYGQSLFPGIHISRCKVIYVYRWHIGVGVPHRCALKRDAGGLELGDQAVQVFAGLPIKGLSGEVGLLKVLQLPLNGDHCLEVPQGNGHTVRIGHLAQVGRGVLQQGLHLLQGVLLAVQVDGLVGNQVSVFIQKAHAVQQLQGFFGTFTCKALQLFKQGFVLLWRVVQQAAHSGQGRYRQHGKHHAQAQQHCQNALLHSFFSSFSGSTLRRAGWPHTPNSVPGVWR